MSGRRTRAGADAGSSAVEFALVFPLIVMLVFGIIGFGIVFNAYLAVTHAAREGARLAAVDKYSEAIVIERAAPLTTAGGLSVAGPSVVADASGPYVQVTVSYPYTLRIPLVGTLPLTVSSTSRMRQEN